MTLSISVPCPNSGTPLIFGPRPNADSPPWKCPVCLRGWWNAEVIAAAVAAWDGAAREFTDPAVIAAAVSEWRASRSKAGEPI